MKKASSQFRPLDPEDASALAQIAQVVSIAGDLPQEYKFLQDSLQTEDAQQIAATLVALVRSRASSAGKPKAKSIYLDAAEDLLRWAETNKSYLEAK
jgi:hypothetical protein